MHAKRKLNEKGPQVYAEVKKLKATNSNISTDRSLFDKVGRKYGVGGSLAEKYYYRYVEKYENM